MQQSYEFCQKQMAECDRELEQYLHQREDRSAGALEAGWDMSKWPDEDHFVSWLRLCPDNRISGNKIIGKGRLSTNNRPSIALLDDGQHPTVE